jgi:glycosyltransferase involved in cell wall biosynthesis
MGAIQVRVALTTSIYPPEIGGPSAQTRDLALALAQRGVSTSVLVCGKQEAVRTTPGLEVRQIVPPSGKGRWNRISRQFSLLRSILGFLRETRPDVVHQQVFGDNSSILVGIACRMLGIPSVLKVTAEQHTEALNSRRLVSLSNGGPRDLPTRVRSSLLKSRDSLCLRLFRQIWVTTPTFRQRLETGFGLPQERLVLYPNFIALDRFRCPDPPPRSETVSPATPLRILTVCRLKPWKGVEDCLTAAAQLPEGFRWRFVGSGKEEYEKELKQMARSLGLEGKVEFLGAIPPDAVAAEYAEADLFVLGSRYEPFGIVLVEAMAMGVPIVATTVGGIPDVLEHERTGLLVPPGHPDLLGASITRLLSDSRRREQLAAAGRQRSLDFGMEHGVEFFLQLYSRMSAARS